jgi:hypothetical protein
MSATTPAGPTPASSGAGALRLQPHVVDPRVPRPTVPGRRDLFATYIDHMRRRAGVSSGPHREAHLEFCVRLRIPDHIADSLWARWVRHYLRYGPDWA